MGSEISDELLSFQRGMGWGEHCLKLSSTGFAIVGLSKKIGRMRENKS